MLRSMTGFGCVTGQVSGVQYAVEARSVNNRYLKIVLKLPESWSGAEAEVEKLVRSHVQRGTVTLSVRMRVPDDKASYRVNAAALSSYIEQLRPMEVEANPMLRIDLGALLQLPGVCEPPSYDEVVRETHDGLMALVDQAFTDLVKMRLREGEELKDDLLMNCDVIEQHLGTVADRAPLVVQDYHERLTARVAELANAGKVQIDKDSLAREVAIFADRSDVAEEISRLRGHLGQFRQATESTEPAGRKLDFIAQEMLREANTIASKGSDVEIARAVVEIKTAVDRIKEQVQNAE